MENVLSQFKHINALFLDVDGVLTDGSITAFENGDQVRTFNVKDGWAMRKAIQEGLTLAVISAGQSEGVRKRLEFLGLPHVYIGVENKIERFDSLVAELGLSIEEIAYMGDDFPDLKVMKRVGLPCCPADAVPEILEVAKFVSPYNGGKGAVRHLIESILKVQGKWKLD